MTRDELASAAEALETAGSAAEDAAVRERLLEHADQLADLAERDQGPDHGRLARHQHVLAELLEAAEGEVASEIERARSLLSAYRETVEGV